MTLVVEDGTGIVGADAYMSAAELITYAALYGVVIADSATAEILIRKGMDYLQSFNDDKFKGTKHFDNTINELLFPRDNVVINNVTLTYAQSLIKIKKVLSELCVGINAGADPLGMKDKVVSQEDFGEFSVTYASGQTQTQSNPKVDVYLQSLLREDNFGGYSFKVKNSICEDSCLDYYEDC